MTGFLLSTLGCIFARIVLKIKKYYYIFYYTIMYGFVPEGEILINIQHFSLYFQTTANWLQSNCGKHKMCLLERQSERNRDEYSLENRNLTCAIWYRLMHALILLLLLLVRFLKGEMTRARHTMATVANRHTIIRGAMMAMVVSEVPAVLIIVKHIFLSDPFQDHPALKWMHKYIRLTALTLPLTESVIQSGVTILMPGCFRAHSNLAWRKKYNQRIHCIIRCAHKHKCDIFHVIIAW